MEYKSRLESKELHLMFDAIMTLKTKEDCYRFFEDLCTIQELQELSQRFMVATMLNADMKYTDIIDKTMASSATISRINKSLHYGADGYKLAIKRLAEEGKLPTKKDFLGEE